MPALGADDVLVETICSGISAGTEMLVYRGEFPHLIDSHDAFSSDLKYPLAYGYANIGRIKETGKNVDKGFLDRLVFGFHPHTSAFITNPSSLMLAPDSLSAEACSFLPNMETAVNLIQDAAPIIGERALVIGQGVVGLLVASLLKEFPLASVTTSDCYDLRRRSSLSIGVSDSFDPQSSNAIDHISIKPAQNHMNTYAQYFDLTFEVSGSPVALNDAIPMTRFSGRIVIGSWYGEKQSAIDLGGSFHRSRIQLISSQVSTIAPAMSGRWDKTRRFEIVWDALKRIQPQKWITHRFPIDEADKAYQLLDKNPQETIQVLFTYSS